MSSCLFHTIAHWWDETLHESFWSAGYGSNPDPMNRTINRCWRPNNIVREHCRGTRWFCFLSSTPREGTRSGFPVSQSGLLLPDLLVLLLCKVLILGFWSTPCRPQGIRHFFPRSDSAWFSVSVSNWFSAERHHDSGLWLSLSLSL